MSSHQTTDDEIPEASIDELRATRVRQTREIEQLCKALAKANAHHEHFERESYLRGDEIERLRNVCADGLKQLDSNVSEIGRLRAAIYQACSDMGCYCADDDPLPENLKCPMCKLEKALYGSAADVSGSNSTTEKS